MRKLVLFDIDGTLLSTDGAAARAFEAALVAIYGTAGPMDRVSFAGKTDPQIAHELMAGAGLARDDVERRLPELWARYLDYLDGELRRSVSRPLPGVAACLRHVEARDDDFLLGVLTGNIEQGARRKLDAAEIGFSRFRVGVFGSDDENRNRLPAIGARRARAHTGRHYEGEDVVIVGDTPADVGCARAFGARAVAVATGTFSREQLETCAPDVLLDSLEDTAAVAAAILGESTTR